jgi:acetyl-CoA carboxylase carboxyltransferase component
MGGDQAAQTLLQIQVAALKSKGKQIAAEEEKALLDGIRARYEAQSSPYYAAARLWVDTIIDPADTRAILSESLNAVAHGPRPEAMKLGVFQV